jgi:hypothetical protein
MNDLTPTILLILLCAIPSFFIIWSFLDNPKQFMEAVGTRFALLGTRIFMLFSGLFWRFFLPVLYIIFDPILIFIDDIIVGLISMISTYYFIKKEVFKSIRESSPFPKPWKKD